LIAGDRLGDGGLERRQERLILDAPGLIVGLKIAKQALGVARARGHDQPKDEIGYQRSPG
jgi:hypothetical protein